MKILLTGTTSGIGKDLLEYLSRKKHEVYVINRKKTNGPYIDEFICDLSNINELKRLSTKLRKINFDVLINNAASGKVEDFEKLTSEDLKYEFSLNTIAPITLIQILLPNMLKNKYGKILNISSISAKEGTPYLYTYSASKAALDSFTQSLAKTYTSKGVRINSICLGGIDTQMSKGGRQKISLLRGLSPEKYQNSMIEKMGRTNLISAKDLMEVFDFYITQKSDIISGQSINICGTLELR